MKRAGPAREPRARLERFLAAALRAVDAEAAVRRVLCAEGDALRIAGERIPAGARLLVVAAGKGAAAMARAVEAVAGPRVRGGLVVTKDGYGLPLERLALRETAHPVPDARCAAAAREVLGLAAGGEPHDVLLVLLSGGASSLLAAPVDGLALADLVATTDALLGSGADIEETNAVRKHLSAIGGGHLALAARAERVVVLAVSDVPGDRLDVIGSGPCAPDPSTYADALRVLETRGIAERVPRAVRAHLARGARGELPETPKPGDPRLRGVRSLVVARNADAVAAAREAAASEARAVALAGPFSGEARLLGRRLAGLGRSLDASDTPACLVAGGESTVRLRGGGRGGRSQELALAAALALDGSRGVALLAAGTDGTDGPTDAAGAYADGGTVARGRERGVDAAAALADNDSYRFFDREGGLLRTGPTCTNVMDLALVWVDGGGRRPT